MLPPLDLPRVPRGFQAKGLPGSDDLVLQEDGIGRPEETKEPWQPYSGLAKCESLAWKEGTVNWMVSELELRVLAGNLAATGRSAGCKVPRRLLNPRDSLATTGLGQKLTSLAPGPLCR